ncbi:DNA-3-methyladenine glycosylase family protein [Halalkalirubrum salinum]|uniref:DNA-3-methyladenine glycosylase family protein n=1 Tax=Halalkalirubrum salinum TaxID=2563889 RepID=UPI0010FB6F9C|nr:DNA-3-methyladenine glycosylase [Halalkalirubrum salinum]
MECGEILIDELAGDFDLQSTVESGQSYLWDRPDGQMYTESDVHGGTAWYETVVSPIHGVTEEPAVVRVRQHHDRLEWESTTDAVSILTHILRLDDDLDAIERAVPADPMITRAFDRYPGMRLVRDPAFPSLISFICSAQMRVSRIHGMQRSLRETYGMAVEMDGQTYYAYPTPESIAARTEAELRGLSLGYRAPYIQRTAEMVAGGEADPRDAASLPYEDAREYLTQFVGVGEKVADCVLLFSLGFTEPVPLDTWIQTAIADYYPDCACGSYAETSRSIRDRFGGKYAGYVQTYVFHHLRNGGE